jgi:protein-tyrosine phosphatase
MIDLHSHILSGLDDGPEDTDGSIAMARVAVSRGVTTIAATPHIREDYPFPLSEVPERADALNRDLASAGLDLEVVPAGEVALTMGHELDDASLRALCLGSGTWLLVESPYGEVTPMVDNSIYDFQRRGFQVLLAHPERSPSFMSDRERLAELVSRGVACSITAASITGTFGRTVQRAALGMLRDGLVHDVASDAHDHRHRPPGLADAAHAIEAVLPGAGAWFVEDAPAALLAGEDRPEPPQSRRRRMRFPKLGRSSGSSSR